jgi:hypothetical protein
MSTTPQQTARRRVRINTIVWGAMLVGAAIVAYVLATAGPLSPAGVLWTVVGFGGLLLVAGVVAAIARAVRDRQAPALTSADEDQPIG